MFGRCLLTIFVITRMFAADPPDFALWKPADLKSREQKLTKNLRPDHSARETLADYKNHRFRMLYRNADGYPEQHDTEIDIVIVQSGEGTLLLGSKIIDPEMNPEANNGVGEWKGTKMEGGERYPLGPGDVVHIPAGIPHSFLVAKGKHITYVLLKIPAH